MELVRDRLDCSCSTLQMREVRQKGHEKRALIKPVNLPSTKLESISVEMLPAVLMKQREGGICSETNLEGGSEMRSGGLVNEGVSALPNGRSDGTVVRLLGT